MLLGVFRVVFLLLVCVNLASCSGDRCIEADDFGHAQFTVKARYTSDELNGQTGENQVAPWLDTSYRVNGRPLVVAVHGWDYGTDYNISSEVSAWCAWYGTKDDGSKLAKICERFRDCEYIDGHMCTNTSKAQLTNAPCLFRNGVGLYALIAEKGTDPNGSISSQRDPRGLSFHVGEQQTDYSMYEVDRNGNTRTVGGRVYLYGSDATKVQYANSKLYFKILDKFYDDNSGQYRVYIKSGIDRVNPDPISYVTKLVKDFLFGSDGNYGLIKNLYMGIVTNPGYRAAVSAILSLYIMWTALSYLAGNLELTHTELIVRVGKVAIVSALLSSEYSWSFFNDYVFAYFVGGVEQILNIIVEAGATGPGSPGILALMIAPQTISKLLSLLFVDWLGFIYIILFFIALYFVLMIFFNAAIIYLTALMAIGMIITMGPIFICFMLFGITRSLFENWLRQLISYAVQPIILFTGLIFISVILRQEVYGALGFRVCKQGFPKMRDGGSTPLFGGDAQDAMNQAGLSDSIFYWWFPQPMKAENFSRETRRIPIPIDHFSDDSNIVGSTSDTGFCEAYACVGDRYVDLPFLDPVNDTRRLNQFWNGKFVQLDGMLLIFAALYLLHKFNGLTISVAKFLTGTSGNFTNLANVGEAIKAQTFDKSNAYIAKLPGRAASAAIDRTIGREKWEALKAVASQYTPSSLIDKARINNLRKEALTDKANPAILEEVQRTTGLNRNKIDPEAVNNYGKALKEELLKNVDPSLPQARREKIAREAAQKLVQKDFASLKGEMSKAKYGMEYDKLPAREKAAIDSLMKDPKLRELSKKASEARRFQEAYVDAYIGMSNRGIGLLGKHSSSLRSVQEIRHDVKERKELKEARQKQFGQELVAEVEGVKHDLYKGISGGREDGFSRALGGSYHEINTDPKAKNYRKQTYAEQLEDRQHHITRTGTDKTIDRFNRAERDNVTSPEFLARAEKEGNSNLGMYKELTRKDISSKVYDALSGTEDPALMGNKYMSEYAKDSEMRHMVDRAQELEKRLMENDEFVSRQSDYQTTYDLAADRLQSAHETLKSHYGKDISADQMPAMMQKYYEETGALPKEEAAKEVDKLKQSITDFQSSQEVLQQIDVRKSQISEEVDKHIDGINEHRKKANMDEYRPPRTEDFSNVRKVRKIDDHLRGKF
ncbi:MAG: type IV secretion system protein [Rickettsiales bacterium]|nr:type IV secretion system protein [Rickettsiales bacterium]